MRYSRLQISCFALIIIAIACLSGCAGHKQSQLPTAPTRLPLINSGLVDYMPIESMEQLEETADLIMLGEPLSDIEQTQIKKYKSDEFEQQSELQGGVSYVIFRSSIDHFSVIPIKIKTVLKGSVTAKQLDVVQPAALYDEVANGPKQILTIDSYVPMQKGVPDLFFLRSYDQEVERLMQKQDRGQLSSDIVQLYEKYAGKYGLVSVIYGKYNINTEDQWEVGETETKNSQFKVIKSQIQRKYQMLVRRDGKN